MNDAFVAVLGSEFPDLQGAIDVDIVAFAERLGYIGNSTVENELVPVCMLFLLVVAGPAIAFRKTGIGHLGPGREITNLRISLQESYKLPNELKVNAAIMIRMMLSAIHTYFS